MDDALRPPEAPAPQTSVRRGFRQVPLRLVLPNVVTLLGLCLGLTAIRFAIEGRIDWAVTAIAAAAILDGLDGRLARALQGTSRFGAELNSLADFVDFGVAPALVLFVADLGALRSLGWVAALLFAVACALRLARFNVMLDEPNQPAWRKNFFVGMPAPAGAIVGLLPIYLRFAFDLPQPGPRWALVECAYILLIALLMASRVPHFSGKSVGRVPREHLAVVLVTVAAALLLVFNFPMQSLVAVTLAYLASIPLAIRSYRAHEFALAIWRRQSNFSVHSRFSEANDISLGDSPQSVVCVADGPSGSVGAGR